MTSIIAELNGKQNGGLEEEEDGSDRALLCEVRRLLGIEDGHLQQTTWTGGMDGIPLGCFASHYC